MPSPSTAATVRFSRAPSTADSELKQVLVSNTMRPEDSGRGIARLPRATMAELGLAEGDVIAVATGTALKDGMAVRLAEAP